jgi:hypothetical protein
MPSLLALPRRLREYFSRFGPADYDQPAAASPLVAAGMEAGSV